MSVDRLYVRVVGVTPVRRITIVTNYAFYIYVAVRVWNLKSVYNWQVSLYTIFGFKPKLTTLDSTVTLTTVFCALVNLLTNEIWVTKVWLCSSNEFYALIGWFYVYLLRMSTCYTFRKHWLRTDSYCMNLLVYVILPCILLLCDFDNSYIY